MAGIRPPGQFNFTKPDEWPKWKKRFEQFRSASKLSTEPDTQQINTLLYCLGEEAESVLASRYLSGRASTVAISANESLSNSTSRNYTT